VRSPLAAAALRRLSLDAGLADELRRTLHTTGHPFDGFQQWTAERHLEEHPPRRPEAGLPAHIRSYPGGNPLAPDRAAYRPTRAVTGHALIPRVTALSLGVLLLGLGPNPTWAGAMANPSTRLPDRAVLACALAAYHRADQAGLVRNQLLTVIDYGLPSSLRRLWVIEPRTLRVLMHEFVAHGRGSAPVDDPNRAVRFGNEPESHRSSLGTFLTGDAYTGEHGYSLELLGLDPGVNDRARERRIVMHPAVYVGEAFRARSGGRVGRSWGCPALDPAVAHALIDRIQAGSVIFAAGPGRTPSHTDSPLSPGLAVPSAGLPSLTSDQGG